jgi:hypothetical protein
MERWKYKLTVLYKNSYAKCADLENPQKPVVKSVRILRMHDKVEMSPREFRRFDGMVPSTSRTQFHRNIRPRADSFLYITPVATRKHLPLYKVPQTT